MAYDSIIQQVKHLDSLYLKAFNSKDPKDWAAYHSAKAKFDRENPLLTRKEQKDESPSR